jgi:type IX secretion system PorP/SprF family membrane protein
MAGIYSYSVEFENSVLSFGLQAGLTNLKIDFDKLVFLDQLNAQGIIPGAASSAVNPVANNKLFFDAGTGVNYVIGDFMVGSSIQHLNNPNESLTGVTTLLPIRLNAYASFKYKLNDFDNSPSLIPSVVVVNQANVSSYSVGMQYKNRGVNVGLWYRSTGQQQDAIVLSVIFDIFQKNTDDKFRFGISHDATTSSIGYSNTAGTTEGSLVYITGFSGRYDYYQNGKNNGNRCYDFY